MGLQLIEGISPWLVYGLSPLIVAAVAAIAWYGGVLPNPVSAAQMARGAQNAVRPGSLSGSWSQLLSSKKWLSKAGLGAVAGFAALAMVVFARLGFDHIKKKAEIEQENALEQQNNRHIREMKELKEKHRQEVAMLQRDHQTQIQQADNKHGQEVVGLENQIWQLQADLQQLKSQAAITGKLDQVEAQLKIVTMEGDIATLTQKLDQCRQTCGQSQ